MYVIFVKLPTNIKKKIMFLLIFDVQDKDSFCANNQRENMENAEFIFNVYKCAKKLRNCR